jgi:hypothetical protein
VTPEREQEIRALAVKFTAKDSGHRRIGWVLVDLLTALDEARALVADLAARLEGG